MDIATPTKSKNDAKGGCGSAVVIKNRDSWLSKICMGEKKDKIQQHQMQKEKPCC